ncbi:MAG: DUF2062 domain-containing protein [Hyphomicrobiales bacterium]|nr:DUF2062 domain-containing protein [Hyphomicrobiales bacterium]
MAFVTTEIPHSGAVRAAGRTNSRAKTREKGWFETLVRVVRYRLHIPMKRSRHAPEHVARGVMIGTVWACTPVFGLHMAGAFLTWLAARKLFGWNFSLVNALAWTWTTNVFTVLPCYYVFFRTGQFMLGTVYGDAESHTRFDSLTAQTGAAQAGFLDSTVVWFESLASGIGMPLAVGWIPWSIAAGWLAYRFSLGFVQRYRMRRARVKAGRRQRLQASRSD